MFGSHRVRTPWDERVLTDGPDGLYQTLDSLAPDGSESAYIEPVDSDGTSVEASMPNDGALRLRFVPEAGAQAGEVAELDILAAYQAIVSYIHRDANWVAKVMDAVQISTWFAREPEAIDYQPTGLSIATAMIDNVKRFSRLSQQRSVPPVIQWGSHEVVTGDLWRDVPKAGSIEIHVVGHDPSQKNGIAVNVPGGSVEGPAHAPAPEVIIWPSGDDRDFRLDYNAPKGLIGICNVYTVGDDGWSRVDRWSENAGMIREKSAGATVIYRCNNASSTPPTFQDICFTMSVRQ